MTDVFVSHARGDWEFAARVVASLQANEVSVWVDYQDIPPSADGTARVWSVADGAPLTRPMRHDDAVLGAALRRDDALVLTWSKDGTARLWEARTAAPVGAPMRHESAVRSANLDPTGTRLLSTAWQWDDRARRRHFVTAAGRRTGYHGPSTGPGRRP